MVAVAGGAAATVAALGFHTAPTSVPGVPKGADLVTVTGTAYGRPVAKGFVGLSLEYTAILPWVGSDPRAPDPVLVKLLDNLAPGTGQAQSRPQHPAKNHASRQPNTGAAAAKSALTPAQPSAALPDPVLRIGGDSADLSWYSPNHRPPPPGIRFTLDRTWLDSTQAILTATHAKLIANLNLKANDARLLSNEVAAFGALTRGAGTPTAFEVGNEPEKFGSQTFYLAAASRRHRTRTPVTARPRRYSFRSYAADFDRYSQLVPEGSSLAAPAVGRQSWWPPIPEFLNDRPRVKLVTLHAYPLHNCVLHPVGPAAPSIPHLLAPAASSGLAAILAPYAASAHHHGAQLRVDELNSVSCGGARGVSDTFASALWALDTLFALAQVGVDGINMHAFPGAAYSPFAITHKAGRWSAEVKPLYLGLLAFTRAAPRGSKLLRVNSPNDRELRVWATRTPGGHAHVVLINTSPTEAHTIAVQLPGGPGEPRLERLIAPSLASTSGVTLAGQSFGRFTTTGEPQGAPSAGTPEAVAPGIYLLRLPAGSAGLLTR